MNPDLEEAHFYFTIHEFEELVQTYGPEQVLTNLSKDIKDQLYADRSGHQVFGMVGGSLSV